jgi:hypothetical protein
MPDNFSFQSLYDYLLKLGKSDDEIRDFLGYDEIQKYQDESLYGSNSISEDDLMQASGVGLDKQKVNMFKQGFGGKK